MRSIVDLQIMHLEGRLASQNLSIILSEAARDELAVIGYDPVYGARPLRRIIQNEIQNELAELILGGVLTSKVTVDVTDHHFNFKYE